ncbi:MAG: Omp28-related outer membrane protein [Saprospiraceae bacterium]|nr:Omp28-related outer membrane protein [Saprospiraceae bacterium]
MKSIFIFILSFSFFCLNAQQVNTKQWSIINKKSADWCTLCGGWGWNFHKQLLDKFENREVLNWAIHYSGGLMNQAAVDLSNNYGGSSQPIFFVEGDDIKATNSNTVAKLAEVGDIIDFSLSQLPYAGVGIDAELNTETNTLTINAKVEFLSNAEGGDYYLGLYLIEDNVVASQQPIGNNAVHRNLLRRSLLSTTWGQALKKGAVTMGTTFDVNAVVENVTGNRENLKVAAVIWNKHPTTNKYLFFNANQVNVGIPASSKDEFTSVRDMKVFQSEGDRIIVRLDIENTLTSANLSVSDINGKSISQQHVGTLAIGSHEFSMEGNFNPGMYLVTLRENNKLKTKKIVIQ